MAIPTYVGASATPGDSLTTSAPTIPSGTTDNDIMMMHVSTANQAVAAISGWTEAPGSPGFTGTAGAPGGIRITVLYRRFVGGDTAPTVADVGDYHYAVILSYRGCLTTGTPIEVADVNAGTGTTVTWFSGTTLGDDRLYVYSVAGDADAATARLSAHTNANLTDITERFDLGTTLGTGGGVAIWDGGKAVAGAAGSGSATIVSQAWASWHGALIPAAAANVFDPFGQAGFFGL